MNRFATSIAIVLACGAAACGGSEPPATTQTQRPATAEQAPAPPPAVGLYVTNEASGELSMIDAATQSVVATIPLGKRPRGVVGSPDGTLLYVALSGSPAAPPGVDEKTLPPPDRKADGIGVVDIRQRKLVRVLMSGPDPEQVAISRDGTRVFVANEDAAQLSVIDTADGRVVDTFKVGAEPEGVSLHPGGSLVYVTSEGEGAVFVVDVARKVVKSVKVGPRPRSIAFLPDGSRAYVPSENGGTLSMIDTKRLATVKTINLGEGIRPMGTVMARDGKHLYVSTGRSKMVFIVDTATNQVVGSVEAGQRPWGIVLSPDGKTIYTANGPSNDVSIIDIATKQVTKKIPVGRGPWGIALVEQTAAGK
jgi:YVTN family beta-propeller protein